MDDNGSEIPGTRKKFAENDQPECTEDLVGKGEEVATETIQVFKCFLIEKYFITYS